MADNANTSVETLKAEFDSLRSQFDNIVKTVESKKGELSQDVVSRIAKELEHYKQAAAHKADQLRDVGQAGLAEVGEHVRRNPVASLVIAFGAGWVMSYLIRKVG